MAFLLVAVAVMLVALRSWLEQPDEQIAIGGEQSVVAEAEPVESITEPEPTVERAQPEAVRGARTTSSAPTALPRVVLLPARGDVPDSAAMILADSIRQATLGALRSMANVEVVDVGPAELAVVVPANDRPQSEEALMLGEVSRHYGGAAVAEIEVKSSNDGLCWALSLQVASPRGSVGRTSRIRRDGDPGPGNDPASIGIRYAAAITEDTRVQDAAAASGIDARNVLVDATRADDERIRALATLRNERVDRESVAAGVELAARAVSPETRQLIWNELRRSSDPALAQPMIIALQSDPDPAVRLEAALWLKSHLSAAGIRPALERAARGDASPDVRLAARMAMMNIGEEQDFKLETLLDRSLTPAERLAPMRISLVPTVFLSSEDIGGRLDEAMLAFAEIIRGTDDPDMKLSALSALQQMTLSAQLVGGERLEPDPAIVSMLIATAATADERVQRAALQAMRPIAGHPEIRAVLESALEANPELANELDITDRFAQPQDSRAEAPSAGC